ncbi:MAG TPA: hypothetical protein VFB04_13730 [Terriglobales bacterium]|nr:hypothetical protein [Terriglobales bacterium]
MSNHIERGNYTADVLHHTGPEPFWYYVVQRKDSNAVIDLVKFESYEQAITASQNVLEKLNRVITDRR